MLETDWFLICLWIIKLESDVSRFDIFFLGNFEKIPEFSRFKTLGTLILNVDDVVLLVATVVPRLTDVLLTAATVNVFPSADIADTLLKTGRLFDPSLNAIIESVFIPTLPEKLLFALVIAVPTALIWSDAEKYGNIRSYNTVSALNVEIPVVPNVLWRIDLISSTVYAIISLIDGFLRVVFSLILVEIQQM